MGVAHVLRAWREGAAGDPDLVVLVELLAGLLALPLDRKGVWGALSSGSEWREHGGQTRESERESDHWHLRIAPEAARSVTGNAGPAPVNLGCSTKPCHAGRCRASPG